MSHGLAEVSFRDPAGFVYRDQGDLRRQVNLVYREHYDQLMDVRSLPATWSAARPLIPHEELADGGSGSGPGLQGHPARADRADLVPLRVELQPVPGRRARHARGPAPCPRTRDVPEGLQRLQRAVPSRPADLHRYALVRGLSRGHSLGGLSPVLRAFPRPAGAHGPDGPSAQPALPHQYRRHPAGSGRATAAGAIVGPLGPGRASATPRAAPAGPYARGRTRCRPCGPGCR